MNRHLQTILLSAIVIFLSVFAARAQVATGGTYNLDQSVIAGGGGTSSSAVGGGNQFSITGAIGQAITETSNASPYKIQSGFFTAAPFGTTAATVTIGGRVLTADGRGIRNVILMLTDSSGSFRTATTTSFGFYHFADVAAGETYVITARGKRFTFTQPSQVFNVNDDATDINFIGYPAPGLRNF